jgi:hypothetical protein
VAEDRPRLEPRRQAVEREQIGPADCGRTHANDRVARRLDLRIGDVVHPDVAGGTQHDRLHDSASAPAKPPPSLWAGSVEPMPAGCSISTR